MFRVLIFAKRLPQLDFKAFQETYEDSHVALVKELIKSGVHASMHTYRRHYILPEQPLVPEGMAPDVDVVVESSFADIEAFQETMANIQADPALNERVQSDFDKFLIRSSLRYLVVETRESHFDES